MRVSPFGHLRISAHVQLPAAFRSLSRPSSAPSAKASALRPSSLDLAAGSSDYGHVAYYAKEVHNRLYAKAVVVSSGAQKIPTGEWQKVQKTFFSSNQVPLGRFPNNAHVPFLDVVA